MTSRILTVASVALVAAIGWSGLAAAQVYPDRPVKVFVPYAAGGNTDAIARLAGQHLSEALGQQFVIENRGGASGAIAVETVARAPADGYTLLVMALPQAAVLPAITKVKYDTVADFAPVSNIGFNSFILTVHPSLPVKTPSELVAYVKGSKDKLTYASGGPATHANLSMVLFLKRTGLDVAPVHLRGGSELLNNVMAGHIPMGFLNASDVFQQAAAGTVRPLGVATKDRVPQLPDLPTMIESGYEDFVVVTWNGVVAPANTPPAIIDKLSAELQKAVRSPKIAERLSAIGVTSIGDTPKAFAETIKSDIKIWGDIVREAGLQEK